MPAYAYRCPLDGDLESRFARGAAPAAIDCPDCGGQAARAFSTPMLRTLNPALRGALDRADSSRDAPQVVSRVPAAGRMPRRSAHPATARLPRP